MNQNNNADKLYKGGISLSVLVFLISITSFLYVNAAEVVSVKSIGFEETAIIEFTNDGSTEIGTIKIWLGEDSSFKSFKTEEGWVGKKTPQGVIIFTSTEVIKPGESVKFGVKTDKVKLGINWKIIDVNEKEIQTGKTITKDLPTIPIKEESTFDALHSGILSRSTFRVIPENPSVGSSIRITGENFGFNQKLDLYLDDKKLESFETNKNGYFIISSSIPENQKAKKVDFIIKDNSGKQKNISLNIAGKKEINTKSERVEITIKEIPSLFYRGDFLEISGSAQPDSTITITLKNPKGKIFTTESVVVSSKGNWTLVKPIIIPFDALIGKYSIEISDGKDTIKKDVMIESSKKIIITPTKLRFELGELLKYKGTASPNKPIEFIIKDPFGNEIFSDIRQVEESGDIEFEYQTPKNSLTGTYTLIAKQGYDKELTYVGLNQMPIIPVSIEFDKTNYQTDDVAKISLIDKPAEDISLLIIESSGKPKGDEISITLGPNGKETYLLDLEGYTVGEYSAVVTKRSAKSSESFTVGLKTNSGQIKTSTTKLDYMVGDPILIIGNTGPYSLITITLTDPDGKTVRVKESFSDKTGKIFDDSFRIPLDAKTGKWSINTKSGSDSDITELEVTARHQEEMLVMFRGIEEMPGVGSFVNIKVMGASQVVHINIISPDGNIIEELKFVASSKGEISQPWKVPTDALNGTYTVKVNDSFNVAETTFELN